MLSAADFDFALPADRIAHHPASPRESARMLCVGPEARTDRIVRDLPDLLRPGDILVANDTRVIPAQLTARRGDARIGITLDRPRADGAWHVLVRNARRLRASDTLTFDGPAGEDASRGGLTAEAASRDGPTAEAASREKLTADVVSRDADGGAVLRFSEQGDAFLAALRQAGVLALPPYIDRPHGPEPADRSDYQTVFAAQDGAVAAPTAGLHFTPDLLAALDARGIRRATVTLHVGAGTFLPMRHDDVSRHRMHPERGSIGPEAAAAINAARAAGGRAVAVGTTSLRLLESAVDDEGQVRAWSGETSLFILPGFRFRAADLLMTNFHLPRSTLFMLVCAFAGAARMRAAYAHAIASGYRFYSYGDASLLARDDG